MNVYTIKTIFVTFIIYLKQKKKTANGRIFIKAFLFVLLRAHIELVIRISYN